MIGYLKTFMAILANQKILTLDYWKRADQIQEGDLVLDRKGQPAKVTLVQKYTPPHCYEVLFNDHLTIAGDEKLAFIAENRNDRFKENQYKGIRQQTRQYQNKQIAHLLEEPLYNPNGQYFFYSVPTTQPINLPNQDLPIPPFIFGFWFFNRRSDRQMCPPQGMDDYVLPIFHDHGYIAKPRLKQPNNRRTFTVTPTIESQLIPNIPTRIPANYLMASLEQRTELLKGILAAKTNQYNIQTKLFRLTTRNAGVLRQVQWLVESLGHRTNWFSRNSGRDHRLVFKSLLHLHPNQPLPPKKRIMARRSIVEVYEIKQQPCVHIETTGHQGTFLVGEGFISCL